MTTRRQIAPAILAILCLLPTPSAFGQTAGTLLPPDHPEVYHSFFFFMESFSQKLDEIAQRTPERKTQVMASAARYLKVDEKELPQLFATCRSVAAQLRQIGDDARQFARSESANNEFPRTGSSQDFATRRHATIQAGSDEMKRVLSPGSWTGLHAHINGDYRRSIRQLNAPQ